MGAPAPRSGALAAAPRDASRSFGSAIANSVAESDRSGGRVPVASPPRMDFMAICTGLGLALAVGLIIGVVVPPIMPAWGAFVAAAPLGVLACIAALNGADEQIWPACPDRSGCRGRGRR